MNKKTSQILKCLLVTIFVCYYCQCTLFIHTHNFDWGTVTHSHPYLPIGQDSQHSQHSHTAAECQTIDSLTNLVFTITGAAVVAVAFQIIKFSYIAYTQSVDRCIFGISSLRAPPYSFA